MTKTRLNGSAWDVRKHVGNNPNSLVFIDKMLASLSDSLVLYEEHGNTTMAKRVKTKIRYYLSIRKGAK